ncbi:diguanylate cyclase [Caldimonas brevitalea]|uniref:Serine/threonine protein kinase n=1 Tax=Caldimonas brevitalea TaxID=413882 RepID=A0A0G3BQV5_9BURK|nr:diguanylate cyclase [Caldimonas brevitalea]AKJ28935.1 hypothetical protein AAW51_2244 [Caldimonas brevitalea]
MEEVLYRSDRTLVTRRPAPSTSGECGSSAHLVLKQLLGADASGRLRHETAILERLAKVDGVVKLARLPADTQVEPNTLAMRDEGGVPLSTVMQRTPLGLSEVVRFGCALAGVLANVHRAGVIHKDINPSNILVSGPLQQPTLIDFSISSNAAEERPGFTHQSHIAGTLAYMSPEQTGRTGRSVDSRADLYALGVTLYELTTGRKPFVSDDLLELVHDHLVQVPVAPASVQPDVPQNLSDVIMRLLEKEPDHRYQSAQGLAYDLARVQEALQKGDTTPFVLGQQDFPVRLTPPSRLVGRDTEIEALRDSVDHSIDGSGCCLLVSGAPGVGKTVLINELRPMVTARHGWFVSGKFDQYRQDAPATSLEALRALGRLLLAESEDQLASHRERVLEGLGSNIGFGPSLLPEFVLLLGRHPRVTVDDPREAEVRMIQATLDLLRSIACPERPLVMVYDDMQWAPSISLSFIDAVVTGSDRIPGLLVVVAYRPNEVDAAHPLSVLMARWKDLGLAPPRVELNNLPPADASTLIGQMLRLPEPEADKLAETLHERTEGNPYDTVELINALRQDELLVARNGLWEWDAAAIRRYVGDASVVDLLSRRIAKLPPAAKALLDVMACLGGEVQPDTLALAGGLSDDDLRQRLTASLEDGLLVTEQGDRTVLRFRHDRVQEAVFKGMQPAYRSRLHLDLARRMVERPELGAAAAEQYLAAVDALEACCDEAERRRVVGHFHHAAARLGALNSEVAERFLSAAIRLLKAVETPADASLLAVLEVEQHRALYSLGRLDEGDTVYTSIVARGSNPFDLVDPAGVQMSSLLNRRRYPESMSMGLELLAELGLPKPDEPDAAIAAGIQRLIAWHGSPDKQQDFERASVDDPRVLATAKLILKTANAAYFCDVVVFAWVILEAHRLWIEHGPCAELMPGVGATPFLLVGGPQDYRGAYEAGRHLVSVGDARGFEPGTSVARCIYSIAAGHWVEPIENVVDAYRRARAELMRAGDFPFASYTFLAGDLLFDCGATLDAASAEVDAGLAFAARSGNEDYRQRYLPRRQLICAMRGETQTPGCFSDDEFDEVAYVEKLGAPGTTSATYHIVRATSAAIYGDAAALVHHAGQAIQLVSRTPGYYLSALARVLQAVALAEEARRRPLDERALVLEELDRTCLEWLTQRAIDAPQNYRHLQRWVEAERAWAAGRTWAAGELFDAAMQEVAKHSRPWHRAVITERAGLFHLALGMEATGRPLLARACDVYEAWGATGKAREMRRVHAFLRGGTSLLRGEGSLRSTIVSTDVVDMMAVLRASQALSSETSLARLTDRVGKVLGAITGATGVQLLVRPDAAAGWFMAVSLASGADAVTVEQAGARGDLPLSVFRYAERTGEVLLVDDATRDDRFAADPYIAKLDPCSLLLAPILNHGKLSAMLMLENRLRRAAFTAERLDSVTLIAGQLSVSLDNALLYTSLERKVAERTAALEEANRRLEQLSLTDALTGLANRRRFSDALDAEWLRGLRNRTPLGLALIDIDFFKPYNDHYGHQGGDACLQLVAKALGTGRRRGSDLVARYGGEEFVLLLPDTDLVNTHMVAERVRAAVEALTEPHLKSPLGRVTISVGVAATVPAADIKPGALIETADAALYEAKRSGRNCVVKAAG